ncbi:collagen alpha-4(VI) chain-like [Schistocerca americana]|uniref:collagen alpha-4(VI) chain-like n=1 Tax=Schistocerca americana TaxID=7009 RepID=UPI001F4F7F45|nr:collagen alpha-4(VI) chain-like [Schistocerca americana]
MTPEEVGEDFVNKINSTLNGIAANMLFLLDESVSVSPQQFEMEKYFVKSVAQAFPLSVNRTAGLITFSHVADVDIPLTQTDTCLFVDSVGNVVYTEGGTSILVALNLAIDEIEKNAVHNTTLVFLVTDGISTTDPAPAADTLKANGDIVFTIGIADYQRDQLEPLATVASDGTPNFFGVSSFEVFLRIAHTDIYHQVSYNGHKCNLTNSLNFIGILTLMVLHSCQSHLHFTRYACIHTRMNRYICSIIDIMLNIYKFYKAMENPGWIQENVTL